MPNQFIILSLPRSRSFWLSKFLSYHEYHCGHEEIRHCRSIDDIKSWLSQPFTGTIETSLAPFWRLIPHYAQDSKIVTIRRPVDDVIQSLVNIGFTPSLPFVTNIKMLDRKLDQLEYRLPHVRSIRYDDLDNETICADLFEYLLNKQHDSIRWNYLNKMNLQIDMNVLLRYYQAHENQLNKLSSTAKSISISLMRPKDVIEDGVVIAEESVDSLIRDGTALFSEHSISVGEVPDSYSSKNIELMRKLEELGCLQTMIARCNGRIFGYLMSIISPTLERQNTKTGVHTLFYTSKDIKNLGMRLQRASVDELKKKGCDEIIFRAGVRGTNADRISILYKRLGAEPWGSLFRLGVE